MSKTYYISVNCIGHKVYKVVGAESEDEAIEAAKNEYQCDEVGAEYNETLDDSYDNSATEIIL
mgnify:CR=1 FL=1